MGLLNFLAAGTSLKGLVRRRAHQVLERETMIPNFGVSPQAAGRLPEIRERRRREESFAAEPRVRAQKSTGPRFRSTYAPEKPAPVPVSAPKSAPVVAPEPEPRAEAARPGWVQKLKVARREVRRMVTAGGEGVQRQFRRPGGAANGGAPRQQRAPSWLNPGTKPLKAVKT